MDVIRFQISIKEDILLASSIYLLVIVKQCQDKKQKSSVMYIAKALNGASPKNGLVNLNELKMCINSVLF